MDATFEPSAPIHGSVSNIACLSVGGPIVIMKGLCYITAIAIRADIIAAPGQEGSSRLGAQQRASASFGPGNPAFELSL